MRFFLLLILVLLCVIVDAQGRVDGFFKGKGNLDVVFGLSSETNNFYFAGKERINFSRKTKSYNTFLAYGITNKLDINLSLPYVNVNDREKDFQDWSVFLKYSVKDVVIQKIKLKIGIAGGFSSNFSDYQVGGGSAIGQQAKLIDVRPVLHFSFPKGLFTTLQGGYSYRFDPVPSSIPFSLKVGLAKSKYYLDIWYDYQYGIGGFDYRGTPSPPSFRELGVSYHKVGGTVYLSVFKFLGVYGGVAYTLAGRNIPYGLGCNIGVVLKHNAKK